MRCPGLKSRCGRGFYFCRRRRSHRAGRERGDLFFECGNAHEERVDVPVDLRRRRTQDRRFERDARRRGKAEFVLRFNKDLRRAQDGAAVRLFRDRLHLREHARREREQLFRIAAGLCNSDLVEQIEDIPQQHADRFALRKDALRRGERRGEICPQHGVRKFCGRLEIRRPEHSGDPLVGEFIAVREAHFGNGEHISVAPSARTGDRCDRLPLVLFSQPVENGHEMFFEILFGDELEIQPHAAGQDRRGDLVRFGRRKDEHGVRGRLFQRL